MSMGALELVGVVVKIVIDRAESGDQHSFNIIHGTIRGSVRDGNGVLYHLVSLREEVGPSNGNLVASLVKDKAISLLVTPKFEGYSLSDAFRERTGNVLVGIARVNDVSVLGEIALDWSKVDYFAVGELSFVNLPKDEGGREGRDQVARRPGDHRKASGQARG